MIASSPDVPAILNEKVARGELGVKTGNGFRGEWTTQRINVITLALFVTVGSSSFVERGRPTPLTDSCLRRVHIVRILALHAPGEFAPYRFS